MNGTDTNEPHPHVPFLYEMATSFLETAKDTLDPTLEAMDGYGELETDKHGRPSPPDRVARRLQELPPEDIVAHVGACLSATTSLGLAYVHSFRLLSLLAQDKDALPAGTARPDLVRLFDALTPACRKALSEIYSQAASHDLEMEIGAGPSLEGTDDDGPANGRDFRSTLADWQEREMLHESHLSRLGPDRGSAIRIFVPLRSLLILDRIIADLIAPRLGRRHETIAQRMSSHAKGPGLRWDEGMIQVSLPRRMGRTLEARWKPSVTSVVRIRESGTATWTPGFETPFDTCSFVGLKPETKYEVKVTKRNDAGESEPAIASQTTLPERKKEHHRCQTHPPHSLHIPHPTSYPCPQSGDRPGFPTA